MALLLTFVLIAFAQWVTSSSLPRPNGLPTVDPEVNMNTSQLIKYQGYPCEEYDVTTSDGYIISVQRIPHGNAGSTNASRPVVFLQHGLLSCSACWVENLANESLGFMLADAGFDVWLGNSRGNMYGLRHQTLSPEQDAFWAFSWDEISAHDVPAMVDKALTVSGATQLSYVGHSQGTAVAFAALSRDDELVKKVKVFVALAPAVYLGNMKSPIALLKGATVEGMHTLFGKKDFLPSSHLITLLGEDFCTAGMGAFVCENVMFLLGGYDFKYLNETRLPVYLGQHPAGTSVQNMIHYVQSVNSGKFQMFDYGPDINKQKYNQTIPPEYDLSAITTPTAIYYGSNDWLAVPEDVEKILPQLRSEISHTLISGYEHLDFIWATNAPSTCYNDVVNMLKLY